MKLSDAIKDIINRFGTKVLTTSQFVNLLADVGGFREEPIACKKIMNGLLESGFGELLFRFSENRDSNWQNLVQKCVDDYAVRSGYKDEIVNKIATQLLYGVGLINEYPNIGSSSQSNLESERHIKHQKELLSNLKQVYITYLSDLLTITTDEFGLRNGYYTSDAKKRLDEIGTKIRYIAKEVGLAGIDTWLVAEKRKVENKYTPTPAQLNAILDNLKDYYISRLTKLDCSTASGEIDFSDTLLNDIRCKLVNLGSLLGKDMEQWCCSENSKLSKARELKFLKWKLRNTIIGAIAIIALLAGGWRALLYATSVDARNAYRTTMASANSEYAHGNYILALYLFQEAEDNYNTSYLSSRYKRQAHTKAVEVSYKIIADWDKEVRQLLRAGKVVQAKKLDQALPSNLVFDENSEQVYQSLSEQIEAVLTTHLTETVNALLNDIYTHNGKLSEAGKAEIEEMIEVVPNNYWLNFIKEKTK